jgi:hypothetical protein
VRKVKAILLLLILVVNASGFYVYYIIQLHRIHIEMRKALQLRPDNELEVLVLTQREFEDARVEEHEVKVHGKMYDIARIKSEGDKVKIYCLHDEKEDDLLAFVDELVSRPIDKTSSITTSAFQFLSLIFIIPDDETSPLRISSTTQNEAGYFFNLTEFISVPSPPPPWRRQ